MPKQGNPSIMLKKAILISKEKTFNLLKNLVGFAPRRKMYFIEAKPSLKVKMPFNMLVSDNSATFAEYAFEMLTFEIIQKMGKSV